MQIIIAARHFDVSDALRQHVEQEFGSLDKFEPRISRVEITLLQEKNRREVEVLASVDQAGTLHAEAEAGDFRTAIDRARDRLVRQLKKQRSRHRNHQGPEKGLPGAESDLVP